MLRRFDPLSLEKARTEGLAPHLDAVRNKVDQSLPIGHCNLGVVEVLGEGVSGFAGRDLSASNGKHPNLVSESVNLCAKVPDAVPDDEAAFIVIGAIALQGIRPVRRTLAEAGRENRDGKFCKQGLQNNACRGTPSVVEAEMGFP